MSLSWFIFTEKLSFSQSEVVRLSQLVEDVTGQRSSLEQSLESQKVISEAMNEQLTSTLRAKEDLEQQLSSATSDLVTKNEIIDNLTKQVIV